MLEQGIVPTKSRKNLPIKPKLRYKTSVRPLFLVETLRNEKSTKKRLKMNSFCRLSLWRTLHPGRRTQVIFQLPWIFRSSHNRRFIMVHSVLETSYGRVWPSVTRTDVIDFFFVDSLELFECQLRREEHMAWHALNDRRIASYGFFSKL